MSLQIVFNQIPEFLVITYAHHITVDNLLNMFEVSGKLKKFERFSLSKISSSFHLNKVDPRNIFSTATGNAKTAKYP